VADSGYSTTATPTQPIGGYSSRQLSDDELDTWNRQAEARRQQIRVTALAMIGRQPDGSPFPPADQAEEIRLATADLRAPLAAAVAERHQIALRLIDRKDAAERAQQHRDAAAAELARLEDAEDRSSRLESDRLAAQFRSGTVEPSEEVSKIEAPDPDALDQARRAVEIAQAALSQLTAELNSTRGELVAQQRRVGLCVLDVVKGELLKIGREVEALDHLAATLRANLASAGFVTANLRARFHWPASIFTTTPREAMHYRPPARPPAPSVDWEAFIAKLYDDPEAELG
jgi:hypothetical protein